MIKINNVYKITAGIGKVIVTAYFLILTIIYPLYVKGGYQKIGEVKYYFFRNVSLIITAVMIFVSTGNLLLRRKNLSITAFYKSISVTDWFMYGYFISVLISYIFTPYAGKAIFGADGWYMGLVSQLLFISIYFLFSRYFSWNNGLLYIILISSGIVFLLGILNRYSIYTIEMVGQTPGFISTLGNINWFCGYWAVICPLGIVFYWNCKAGWQQMTAGIYVIISFLVGIIQGSSSAYLVLAVLFLFLFVLSFHENIFMERFLQLCMLLMLSCQAARLFRHLPAFTMNYENELGAMLTDSNVTLFILILTIFVYRRFCYFANQKGYDVRQHKKLRNIALCFAVAAMLIYIVLLISNTCLPKGLPGLAGVSLFTFDNKWASYRGAAWRAGIWAYQSMTPLYKLTGIGADCFTEYIYSIPELSEYVFSQFGSSRLTNAHNEWLTLLVNQGAVGLAFYAGLFVAAFIRFIKKAGCDSNLYLFAAAILLYTVHNIVSFQQVLNAPFVFMALGIGEGICRSSNAH